ncbi:uncharacterized protein LOC125238482 [Leguminivora glycinivorella]|nr:uncharacterized protein LOC125233381 [Leguminivora glycinivorella]XP_048001802.1 uncharacterized protein LOC125238482 [Leguminivora glycinivorella]
MPQDIIKALGDAGRLICDIHHRESLSRRYAILNILNKNVRDALKDTRCDEYLFGNDLSDHIKSSKAINKTGSDMKFTPLRPAYRPPATQFQRGALNSRGAPPRIPAATEPRPTHAPAPHRPYRQQERRPPPAPAPRGRRYSSYTRHQHYQRTGRR